MVATEAQVTYFIFYCCKTESAVRIAKFFAEIANAFVGKFYRVENTNAPPSAMMVSQI